MKKMTMLLLACIFALTLTAQPATCTLRGRCDTSVRFLRVIRFSNVGTTPTSDTIFIKKDRTFFYKTNVTGLSQAFLSVSNTQQDILLKDGFDIQISVVKDSLTFSGSAARYNQYFFLKQRIDHQFLAKPDRFPSSRAGYLSRLDSVSVNQLKLLGSYFVSYKNQDLATFTHREKASIIYCNQYRKLMSGLINAENFNDRYSSYINFRDSSLLPVFYYREFVRQFAADRTLRRQTASGRAFDITAYLDTAMTVIDELAGTSSANGRIKAIFLNNLVEEIIREKKSKWWQAARNRIVAVQQTQSNPALSAVLQKLDEEIASFRFQKGRPAPPFLIHDSTGKSYTLADFKGRRLYIKLGAAWCAPCIEGIPAWNKMVADSAKGSLAMVYISLDDNEKEFQKFLRRFPLKSLNLFAGDGGFKSSFAKDYAISGLPQFILIDATGNIEDMSAPHPEGFSSN